MAKRNFRKKTSESSEDEAEISVNVKKPRTGASAALLVSKPKDLDAPERTYGLIEKRDFKHTLVRQGAMPEQQILKKSEMRRKDLIEQEIIRIQGRVPKIEPKELETLPSTEIKFPMNKLIRPTTKFKGIEVVFLGPMSRKKNEDDTDNVYRKLAQLGKLPEEAVIQTKPKTVEEKVGQVVDGVLFKVDKEGKPLGTIA